MRWPLLMLLSLSLLAPAFAADRAALVIGNAGYEVGQLRNPLNDATDVAGALRSIGFDVIEARDAGREDMLRALAEFRTKIKPGGLAVAYYSGHGVEVDGQNWLLPVKNGVIRTQADVPIYSVSAQDVLRKMEEGGARLNFLILDACRDNPLPAGAKSASRGLARMDTGGSTLVAYATWPGKTAADGSGRNSPYTEVLKEALKRPGLSVTDLVNQVGAQVQQSTGGAQVPWNSGTPIWPPVMLAGVGVVQQPAASVPATEGEIRIEVSPATSTVRVDGVLVGTGSRSVRQASGKTVVVRAEAAGHEPMEERVLVQGGQVADVLLRLKAVSAPQPPPTLAPASSVPGPSSTATVPPAAGKPYRRPLRSGGEGPEMVVIPGGRFLMGSPASETGRESDEGPQREVTIRSFGMGVTEVTFADWDRCVSAGSCKYRPEDRGWGRGDRPVIHVSWDDAQGYARWLSSETGRRYRLPSEAEWEYAARGGTTSAYWWGDSIDRSRANYGNEECCSGKAEGSDRWEYTSPVKSFAANAFGLYDTAGNVWEWVTDCYKDSYQGAPSDGRPVEASSCERRVLRGASWGLKPSWLRSANRSGDDPTNRYSLIGFRLAEDL